MAARTLRSRTSLLVLRSDITYTFNQVDTHPLTKEHAPTFTALRGQWDTVLAQEISLSDTLSAAQARVDASDANLNEFASLCSKTILTITHDNRNHSLYQLYFGKKPLSDFIRPILGEQLQAMRGWVSSLKTSDQDSLKALGMQLEPLIAEADEALAMKESTVQEKRIFREVGERKKLFNKVNATRKAVFGEIAQLPHQITGLPTDFADRFFQHETSKPDAEIDGVKAAIATLQEELAEQQELLAMLEEEEMAKEQAKTTIENDLAALTALEKSMAQAEQKATALRAKISADKRRNRRLRVA